MAVWRVCSPAIIFYNLHFINPLIWFIKHKTDIITSICIDRFRFFYSGNSCSRDLVMIKQKTLIICFVQVTELVFFSSKDLKNWNQEPPVLKKNQFGQTALQPILRNHIIGRRMLVSTATNITFIIPVSCSREKMLRRLVSQLIQL